MVVGIECASKVRLNRFHKRITQLQGCLPPDNYIIAVFPETANDEATKTTSFVDEVWITNKNGTIEQMMFTSTLHKE
jgi:hypothetical protein